MLAVLIFETLQNYSRTLVTQRFSCSISRHGSHQVTPLVAVVRVIYHREEGFKCQTHQQTLGMQTPFSELRLNISQQFRLMDREEVILDGSARPPYQAVGGEV